MSAVEETAARSLPRPVGSRPAATLAALAPLIRCAPWGICVITAAAAALRFVNLAGVSPNDFYDAAVRSMSMSWHNFFFGAFDPGATLALDKPPLDLWLQVISVKLFGWGSLALKLPEALGGTLSVPLLYDAVRRVVGRPAGLAAAAALAVLPESVLTSRSDTMDSVMMLLVIAALWLTIRAASSGHRRPLVLAGVVLGLAFNVKLLEGLIAVPALVVFYMLAVALPWRRKLGELLLAGAAMLGVGLSWSVAASLAPGAHPWPVGSSNGTIWNAIFVFNGVGKVSGLPSATSGGPGPFRLFVSTAWHYDVLFGCMLFAALAIGVAGAVVALRRRPGAHGQADAKSHAGAHSADRARTLARAFAASLAVWIAVAIVVFDLMGTVHARYLEALAPGLAAAIGYGAATLAGLCESRGRSVGPSTIALTVALVGICAYTFGFRAPSIAWAAGALIVAALGAALLTRAGGAVGHGAKWLTVSLILAAALVFPAHESLSLVRSEANDSLGLATAPAGNTAALSSYLSSRTTHIRYELAVDEPLALAPLIIHDQRPILPLTSFGGRPLVGLPQLLAAVRAGTVRYGLVGNYRCGPKTANWAACGPAAMWIRAHGVDVTPAVGLLGSSRLYRLPSATAASSSSARPGGSGSRSRSSAS
ncbi:MAG: ArnT family glycosyltransferase [Solirubrobacteraceae bacterium]